MRDAHQIALLRAAERLGVTAEDLTDEWGMDAVRYRHGRNEAVIIDGRINAGLSHDVMRLCLNKVALKSILCRLGLPTPRALNLPGAEVAELEQLLARGPVVCKPRDGEWGEGVAMGLTRVEDVIAHARSLGTPALVEEQRVGRDLRLQALGGELVAACVRVPAAVVGDGQTTLAALIEARAREVSALNPDNRLEVDASTMALLREQHTSLDEVPTHGREVLLKRVSNLSQGGRAMDVTHEIHGDYRQWIKKIAATLELDFFAVDALTRDPSEAPANTEATILEVNAPCQWLAHTFSEVRTHDLPAMVLRHLLHIPK